MTDQLPVDQTEKKLARLVIVGGDASLHYLLERYAERLGYAVSVEKSPLSAEAIQRSGLVAVVFPSVEILEGAQALAAEITNWDIPIIVCSTVLDQVKTRALGADYYLLHPVVFDSFLATLRAIAASRSENHPVPGEAPGPLPINPVQ